jgi:hypothetical protein
VRALGVADVIPVGVEYEDELTPRAEVARKS